MQPRYIHFARRRIFCNYLVQFFTGMQIPIAHVHQRLMLVPLLARIFSSLYIEFMRCSYRSSLNRCPPLFYLWSLAESFARNLQEDESWNRSWKAFEIVEFQFNVWKKKFCLPLDTFPPHRVAYPFLSFNPSPSFARTCRKVDRGKRKIEIFLRYFSSYRIAHSFPPFNPFNRREFREDLWRKMDLGIDHGKLYSPFSIKNFYTRVPLLCNEISIIRFALLTSHAS